MSTEQKPTDWCEGRALGGVRALAISHPHYYSTRIAWSRAFDPPIELHSDDLTLLRYGSHFAGGQMLH